MQNFRTNNRHLWLDRGSDTLVISVGDSWTWGDALGNIFPDNTKDDKEARFNNCYGRLISDYYNADWLNFAVCGTGNSIPLSRLSDWLIGDHSFFCSHSNYLAIKDPSWPDTVVEFISENKKMAEMAEHTKSTDPYSEIIESKKYKNIKVFFTLTETGRDAMYHVTRNNINFPSVENYIEFEENWTYQGIDFIKSRCNVEFYTGRNFTVDLPATKNSCNGKDDVWIKQTFFCNQQENFHQHELEVEDILVPGAVSQISLLDNIREANINGYKDYLSDQVTKADKLWLYLRNNPLHIPIGSCPPGVRGHRLWADYMLEKANK